jgi:hypothetical protein
MRIERMEASYAAKLSCQSVSFLVRVRWTKRLIDYFRKRSPRSSGVLPSEVVLLRSSRFAAKGMTQMNAADFTAGITASRPAAFRSLLKRVGGR